MTEAPFLTLTEVRQEVERIFRRDHRSRLVALFGRTEAASFEFEARPWRVIPTQSELELRERLPTPKDSRHEGRVYLIDWTTDVLPLDIACRLAGGRLYHVARDARLAALFGARFVEPGMPGSALAKVLLAGAVPQPRKVQGLRLTRADAWQALLEARWSVPATALGSTGHLLAWAAGQGGGPAFVRQAENEDVWRNVRRELHEWLRSVIGEAGLVVWQAWERGQAGRLLDVLPLVAAARTAGDGFLAGQVAGQLSAWLPELAAAVRAVEETLANDTVLDAALPTERDSLLAILERSEALANHAGLQGLTASSRRLPGGHAARESALAGATDAFLRQRDAARATAVIDAHAALCDHVLDKHLRSDPAHRDARRGLVRLVVWLAGRPTAPGPAGTRWQPAVDLARSWAEEGGYLDWARQQVRALRGADQALLQAARALEAAVGAALRDDHRAFAAAYVHWVDAGKPSSTAVPIEDVGRQVIKPFLDGNPQRKLLVVLMDGMSQAAATQMLTRLGSARRWGPIAWRKDGWHGLLPLPPVLAVAPTLTELSRGAFFAGKVDPRFGSEGSDKDPARWRAHRVLADFLDKDAPPLFVRRDILSGHDLAPDIRDAIENEARVVAVVVNAIDEELKGSVQVTKDYGQIAVPPLEALLSAAEEGRRAVLLIADHGHVLGDGTRVLAGRLGGGRPGGARWRALSEGEQPAEEEVALPTTSWVPRDWHRVAALWDPAAVNRSANHGEHGGLSLAEAVAPAILVAPDWLERMLPDDAAMAVRALPTPTWWDLKLAKPPARTVLPPVAPVLAPGSQRSLFDLAPPVAVPPPPAPQPLVEALRRSPIFGAQVEGKPAAEVERVLSWLGALAEAGDALPAADFAVAAGVRVHQVAGAVARMGMLNVDGFAMVEHDHIGRRVVLHRARLAQHYGVSA